MPVEGNFKTSFEGLLGLREALALPRALGRPRWLGGDATLDRIGALDWTSREYIAAEAAPYLEMLRSAPGVTWQGEGEIIAVVELLCLIALAAEKGPDWFQLLL
eukprot:4127964-Pyramimonas_sp.AAC.1